VSWDSFGVGEANKRRTVVYGQRPFDSLANSMTEVEHDFPTAQAQIPSIESPRGEFPPSAAKASNSETGILDLPPSAPVAGAPNTSELPEPVEVPHAETFAPSLRPLASSTEAMDLDNAALTAGPEASSLSTELDVPKSSAVPLASILNPVGEDVPGSITAPESTTSTTTRG
jgi:hypothetical protein